MSQPIYHIIVSRGKVQRTADVVVEGVAKCHVGRTPAPAWVWQLGTGRCSWAGESEVDVFGGTEGAGLGNFAFLRCPNGDRRHWLAAEARE